MKLIQIAIDAVGGDYAPAAVIEGAILALEQNKNEFAVTLVGPKEQIQASLSQYNIEGLNISVLDAPEIIGMEESPALAVKTKTQSSMHIGLGAHKKGLVDAFVSAGNTGAIMASSFFVLGRLPYVSRPSVLSYYPTIKGHCVVLDVGTNVDCKPEHLQQFAYMGSIFAEKIMKVEKPKVALMNIGEESSKGNDTVKQAYQLLSNQQQINFIGNIEGRDLLHHHADVVVCDGFVGNIMLKLGESVATALNVMIAKEMQIQKLSSEEQKIVAKVLSGVQKQFDYEEYGGAPLLGVAGNVLIGHGGSNAKAMAQMILTGVEVVKQNIATAIASSLEVAHKPA